MNSLTRLLTAMLLTVLLVGPCPAGEDPLIGGPWLTDLDEAHRRAVLEGKPVLAFVVADYCPWCRKLEETFHEALVHQELADWAPVQIDAEKSPELAARLGAESLPALRAMSSGGHLLASSDGYLPAEELIEWLRASREKAEAVPDDVLLGTSVPDAADVARLVRVFASREASLREAAVRRLLPHASVAGPAVVESFEDGGLNARLTALEVLDGWKAPIDGLDPWLPDTLTESRLDALRSWGEQATDGPMSGELAEEELINLAMEMDRMLQATEVDADVIRLRLGRLGKAAMPEVLRRLEEAELDQERRRLLALRYQLLAHDALELSWPGGISRLAATDSQDRQEAAEELAGRADARDLPLLLALLGDPDAMVREICLRSVQSVGGSGVGPAIGGLLKDPDANVRAVVLNLLAEAPQASMVSKVAEYLETETDPDLIVHAVRFLRAVESSESVKALIGVLDHESWQVRAEAAEGLGQWIESDDLPAVKLLADVRHALVDLLSDDDAFVVSRAVAALNGIVTVAVVHPLLDAAESHPQLAADIIQALTLVETTRSKALPRIRELAQHEAPLVRAAMFRGVYSAGSGDDLSDLDDLLLAGLNDESSVVRIASAGVVVERCESEWSLPPVPKVEVEIPAPEVGLPQVDGRVPRTTGEWFDATDPITLQRPSRSWDDWLAEYLARELPESTIKLVAPLEKMLEADDVEERLAAALALLTLGQRQSALPVLAEATQTSGLANDAESLEAAAEAMRWLAWPDRSEFFIALLDVAAPDQFALLVGHIMVIPDSRVVDLFLAIAADPDLTPTEANALYDQFYIMAVVGGYFDDSGDDTREDDSPSVIDSLKGHAAEGSELQRLAALTFLTTLSRSEAAATALEIVDDETNPAALRRDALQIALFVQRERTAVQTAVAWLSSEDANLRQVALAYLMDGPAGMLTLRETFSLIIDYDTPEWGFVMDGRRIIPTSPRGLKADDLLPLLDDMDPAAAARAGYLLAVLEDSSGLRKLLDHWRERADEDPQLDLLVYRAVSALDAPSQAATLEIIYERLAPQAMPNFYWTIRAVTDPEVFQLRKRIRDEVGAENLQ